MFAPDPSPAPPAQLPAARHCPGLRGRTRRHAAALALPLAAGAVPLVGASAPTPAAADYAYTSECRITYYVDGGAVYRKFRARVARSASGANWSLSRYDYTYTIDPSLDWGPHSDERLDVIGGYVSGANPWHSPDNHTSNVAWVSETGWKGSTDIGTSELKFHAWFDVPSANDPECNVYTPVF